jgi:hypothetical protein
MPPSLKSSRSIPGRANDTTTQEHKMKMRSAFHLLLRHKLFNIFLFLFKQKEAERNSMHHAK